MTDLRLPWFYDPTPLRGGARDVHNADGALVATFECRQEALAVVQAMNALSDDVDLNPLSPMEVARIRQHASGSGSGITPQAPAGAPLPAAGAATRCKELAP
jgi:hypothetical protein